MELDEEELKATKNREKECEYCNGKFVEGLNMSKPILSGYCDNLNQSIFIGIEEKEMRIYNDEDAGYTYIEINYCPMCGRKLV